MGELTGNAICEVDPCIQQFNNYKVNKYSWIFEVTVHHKKPMTTISLLFDGQFNKHVGFISIFYFKNYI